MIANKDKSEQTKLERELVAGCVANEKNAWVNFVDAYGKLIYKIIYKTLQPFNYNTKNDLVEELYNEVFLAFLSNGCSRLKSFKWKNGSSLATWIRLIAHNITLDYIRKSIKENHILQSANEIVYADGKKELIELKCDEKIDHTLNLLESEENKELLKKAFEKLPSSDKHLVELLFFQNFSHEDAAAALGKTVDAIYMQKKRLMQKLKEIVEKFG